MVYYKHRVDKEIKNMRKKIKFVIDFVGLTLLISFAIFMFFMAVGAAMFVTKLIL